MSRSFSQSPLSSFLSLTASWVLIMFSRFTIDHIITLLYHDFDLLCHQCQLWSISINLWRFSIASRNVWWQIKRLTWYCSPTSLYGFVHISATLNYTCSLILWTL
jgi:hypothetical protein